MAGSLPNGGLQIRSTVGEDGRLDIELAEVPVGQPEADQVVIKVEAAPINPSDIIPMLAGAKPDAATFDQVDGRPIVSLQLSPELAAASAGRAGYPMPVGLEGAGIVVAAGADGQALIGKRVSFLSMAMGSLAQYCTVSVNDCMPLPADVTAQQGADLFCNPLTVLAMIEALRQSGQTAMIHTAAASNLGKMLVRVCQEDGVPLVNVVRRAEHVELLRSLGAEHVCNSSDPGFADDLARAVAATGARVAFDAIGGGDMASQLLVAMEAAAASTLEAFNPYGSSEMKRVYVYGLLDKSPTNLPRESYGLLWGVEGWAMPPVLERAGQARTMELTQRIADNLTTTFASDYGHEISLTEALQRDAMLDYCRQATGEKYLVAPWK